MYHKGHIGQIYHHRQLPVLIPCMGNVLSYIIFRNNCCKSLEFSKKENQEKSYRLEKAPRYFQGSLYNLDSSVLAQVLIFQVLLPSSFISVSENVIFHFQRRNSSSTWVSLRRCFFREIKPLAPRIYLAKFW